MANPTPKDMTGQKFGKLIVLKKTKKKNGPHAIWLCWLDTGSKRGKRVLVQGNTLRSRGYKGTKRRRKA